MIALLALFVACAPEPDADPCAELQDAIAACGFAPDDYECNRGGENPDPDLLGCMAGEVAADPACDKPGTLGDYTDLTGPAFVACSGE